MRERVAWPVALQAGLIAALLPLLVLIVTIVTLGDAAPALVLPVAAAAVAAGIWLARLRVARTGWSVRGWILVVAFVATALPAFGGGAVGIAAGWLLVSTAVVRLSAKPLPTASDPSVSGF